MYKSLVLLLLGVALCSGRDGCDLARCRADGSVALIWNDDEPAWERRVLYCTRCFLQPGMEVEGGSEVEYYVRWGGCDLHKCRFTEDNRGLAYRDLRELEERQRMCRRCFFPLRTNGECVIPKPWLAREGLDVEAPAESQALCTEVLSFIDSVPAIVKGMWRVWSEGPCASEKGDGYFGCLFKERCTLPDYGHGFQGCDYVRDVRAMCEWVFYKVCTPYTRTDLCKRVLERLLETSALKRKVSAAVCERAWAEREE